MPHVGSDKHTRTHSHTRPLLHPHLRSAPTVTSVQAGAPAITTATVTIVGASQAPPSGWSAYNVSVCAVNPASGCTYQACTPVRPSPSPTTCTLTGLSQSTTYAVRARSVQGSIASDQSAAKNVTTLTQE